MKSFIRSAIAGLALLLGATTASAQRQPIKPWSHIVPTPTYRNTQAEPLSYLANAIAGPNASVEKKHRIATIIRDDNPRAFGRDDQYTLTDGKRKYASNVDGLPDHAVRGAIVNLERALLESSSPGLPRASATRVKPEYEPPRTIQTPASTANKGQQFSYYCPITPATPKGKVNEHNHNAALTQHKATLRSSNRAKPTHRETAEPHYKHNPSSRNYASIDSIVGFDSIKTNPPSPHEHYVSAYSQDSTKYTGAVRQKIDQKKARIDSLVDSLNTHHHDLSNKQVRKELADSLGIKLRTLDQYVKHELHSDTLPAKQNTHSIHADTLGSKETAHGHEEHTAANVPLHKQLRLSGLVGAEGSLDAAQRILPIGQVLFYPMISAIGDADMLHFRLGVSSRPYTNEKSRTARLFVTAANLAFITPNTTSQLGVPDLQIGNSAYNTLGTNPCGCSGNPVLGNLASKAGLFEQSGLLETNGVGGSWKYATPRYSIGLGGISVLQSDVFSQGERLGYVSAHFDLHNGSRFLGSLVNGTTQQFANVGVQHWLGNKVQGRLNIAALSGANEGVRTDLFMLFFPNSRNVITYGGAAGSLDLGRGKYSSSVNWTADWGDVQTNLRWELVKKSPDSRFYVSLSKRF